MEFDDQIPEVVELSVRGQSRVTSLSILTKDPDSVLAAMFTNRVPVFKDKENRYFIDANPNAFETILEFLKHDSLPRCVNLRNTTTGFDRGGFGFGQRTLPMQEPDLRALYKEAKYFGIKDLVRKLEDFRPILMDQRLEDYRKSKKSYDECLSKILGVITGEEILYGSNITVQLRQETQTIEDPKCCEHQCIDDSSRSFGQTQDAWVADVVVTIPAQLDVALFKILFTDLQDMGYNIQGRLAVCHYRCNKKSKKGGMGFGFGLQPEIFCCMENLYLIQFSLASSPSDNLAQFQHTKQGAVVFGGGGQQTKTTGFGGFGSFGTKTGQGQLFGSASVQQQQLHNQNTQQHNNSGFTFGSPPAFGSLNNQQGSSSSPFGSNSAPTPGFGHAQSAGGGGKPQGAFGSSTVQPSSSISQSSGFGFGGFGSGGSASGASVPATTAQQPTAQFGSSTTSGFSFGSKPNASGNTDGSSSGPM